jgi:hypothetical protein
VLLIYAPTTTGTSCAREIGDWVLTSVAPTELDNRGEDQWWYPRVSAPPDRGRRHRYDTSPRHMHVDRHAPGKGGERGNVLYSANYPTSNSSDEHKMSTTQRSHRRPVTGQGFWCCTGCRRARDVETYANMARCARILGSFQGYAGLLVAHGQFLKYRRRF